MKFSTNEDIEAPIEEVFAAVSNLEFYERAAIRRGAEVTRTSAHETPQPGMTWKVRFIYRNRQREMRVELVELDPPQSMSFESQSGGLQTMLDIELVALAKSRTRLSVGLELRPLNLPARLLVQSLKLAKGNLQKRFKKRVADFALELGQRQARA